MRAGIVTYAPTRVLDGVKSLSYAANMLCTRLARERGFDEALLVTPHGRVLEAPTSSLFWVDADGALCTPPLDEHILASITRDRLIDLVDVGERPCPTDDLLEASEAFLASTTREVQSIGAIEDVEFEEGAHPRGRRGVPRPRGRGRAELGAGRLVARARAGSAVDLVRTNQATWRATSAASPSAPSSTFATNAILRGSMNSVRIVTVIGNRPQFVKAAAVSRLLRERHEELIVHTGQHYDDELSRVFFEELGIPRPTASSAPARDQHRADGAHAGRARAGARRARRRRWCSSTGTPTRRSPARWPPRRRACRSATSRPACARSTARCPRSSTGS